MTQPILLKIIITFLLFVSCKPTTDTSPPILPANSHELKITDREVVLHSMSDYKRLGLVNASIYELIPYDISKIKKIITQAVKDGNFKFLNEPSVEKIWSLYHLQYLPYLNSNGQKLIMLNAICNESKVLEPIYYINEITKMRDTLLWSDFLIDMRDGGSCYWSVKINLDTMQYVDLSVNGY